MSGGATSGKLLVHGTCIAMSASGVLLRGAPGSGKSDLALRFISLFGAREKGNRGACLVADDRVLLFRKGPGLIARSPETIAGRLEVRGVGIVEVPHCKCAPLTLVVDLVMAEAVPRLPPDPLPCEEILGVRTPVLKLNPFENSCPVKLKLALTGKL